MNLIEKIYLSIINKENTNIWDIAENNKNYSLDILSGNSSFKEYYNIHHLLNWFNGDKLFSIKYQRIKSCNLCFNYESDNLCYQPFIPINNNELNHHSNLVAIIYSKFSNLSYACPLCFYTSKEKGEDINNNPKY